MEMLRITKDDHRSSERIEPPRRVRRRRTRPLTAEQACSSSAALPQLLLLPKLWCQSILVLLVILSHSGRQNHYHGGGGGGGVHATSIPCQTDQDCFDAIPTTNFDFSSRSFTAESSVIFGSDSSEQQQQQEKEQPEHQWPYTRCLPTGFCQNPMSIGGCLYNYKPGWTKFRVCNSQDSQDAIENGHCILVGDDDGTGGTANFDQRQFIQNVQQSIKSGTTRNSNLSFGYNEVRIYGQNWESVFFEAWILQILLSEILHVPTSVETGERDKHVNLYHPESAMDYGTSNEFHMLDIPVDPDAHGTRAGDCRLYQSQNDADDDDDEYKPCAHVVPEVWIDKSFFRELTAQGVMETPLGLGSLGQQSWFVPIRTLEQDPSLSTYLGMSGQENRRKLAETFLSPTTWGYFCSNISANNCTDVSTIEVYSNSTLFELWTNTNITAFRAPTTDEEAKSFFVPGLYRGYFRQKEENNCDTHEFTCRGELIDYPCGWTSYSFAQAYHLDIALDAVKYEYEEMKQILSAANYTKSNLVIHWWTPEAIYQQQLGSDFEMVRTTLPSTTQDCIEARVSNEERCSSDFNATVGSALGACDEAAHPLLKIVSSALWEMTKGPHIPLVAQSPAYDAIKSFTISDFQVGKIFDYWDRIGNRYQRRDQWRYDPREATCQWVVDNFELISSFVPRTHPRVLAADSDSSGFSTTALNLVTLIVACIALTCVLLCGVGVYAQRNKRSIRRAQLDFIFFLFVGLVMMGIAAVLLTLQPTDGICTASLWMWSLGYTLELVPLIVKIAAINRLMQAAQAMRRVKLQRKSLFGVVFGFVAINIIFLSTWTAIDPPSRLHSYQLTGEVSDDGDTVVARKVFCSSQESFWRIIAVAWQCLLLICATVLAWQTRNLRQDMNESETLALLIYSHFFFVLLRLCSFFLEDAFDRPQAVADFRSLLLSGDIFATVFIYFLPKLLTSDLSLSSPTIRTAWMALEGMVARSTGRASQASNSRLQHQPEDEEDDVASSDIEETENDYISTDHFRLGSTAVTAATNGTSTAESNKSTAVEQSSGLPVSLPGNSAEIDNDVEIQAGSDTSNETASGGENTGGTQGKDAFDEVEEEPLPPASSPSYPARQHLLDSGLRCRHCGKTT
eukprot:CAMPEP_0113508744 /NCGR_PEP_ID=MMETSP0014_2-20120614/37187_1 /TAXON_ID=2857 /ORGANISM="Nitzschia sp." /LENGTH=1130 /DNA_ID=CAMNT_0000404491 /DNA_START=363 /DNA_END=3755 /DNA_ORIENTATION=+ /assembly_acc=CAM_ASM_000159